MSITTIIHELSRPTLKIALLSPEEPGKSFVTELEERLKPTIPYEKLETLYRVSGLVFSIIEKYTRRIIGQGFYFEGASENTIKEFETWAKQVKLKQALADSVRDIFLAGGAWGENVLNKAGNDIVKIKPLNPSTMDFIRKRITNEVSLLEDDTPEGYVRTYRGQKKIYWRKDTIEKAGEIIYKAKKKEDCRKRIFYLKFWTLSESYIGYTPLVSIYKDELIRLNIADAVGESAFRGTGIIATISSPEGVEIPSETLDKLERDLRQVRSKTIFIFPSEIEISRFPIADMSDMHLNLNYFTNTVCTGLGLRREIIMSPTTRMPGIDIASSREDFELDVMALQDLLAEQVNEQIIKYRAELKGIEEYPVLKFRSLQRAVKLSEARRRATLARAGLLTYDPELEIKIRDEEGLPHSLLDKEKDNWSSSKRKVNKEKLEESIREILEEYME